MAFSGSCLLLGRHNFYRNVIQNLGDFRNTSSSLAPHTGVISRLFSIDIEHVKSEGESKPQKKLSNAMKAYLIRAKEHDAFMKKETEQYLIGKRHLANMMGENPDSFTQKDVNDAVQYLFPSGLYDRKARPIMEEPHVIFPPRKAAEFDEQGRPFHSLFYTSKPLYYQALYDFVEKMDELNKIEDTEIRKGLSPSESDKVNLIGSGWLGRVDLEKVFLEATSDKDYDYFITCAERLVSHPYSAHAKDLLMKFRKLKQVQTQKLLIPPLEFDDEGRSFIIVKDCMRRTSRGTVKILGDGTGKITINGKDITYFHGIQDREQVIFPLIFTGLENSVDVEAEIVDGGPSGQSGAIRWGIAWGLRSFVDLRMVEKMRIAGLLTRDWRIKERKKPGQEGARRKFTWRKR